MRLVRRQLRHRIDVEPGNVHRLVVVDPRRAADEPAPHRGVVPVHEIAVGAGQHLQRRHGEKPLDPGHDRGLLHDLPQRAGGRLLAGVEAPGDQRPQAVVRPAYKQDSVLIVENDRGHARQRQRIMSDLGAQGEDELRNRHSQNATSSAGMVCATARQEPLSAGLKASMNNVIVVGSVNVDVIARVAELPAPGQTLLGTESAIRPGGKGANQAVAAARLGAPTRMIAAVGDDDFGNRMIANLADAGVDVAAVARIGGESTGLALIVVAADGENTVVVAPGANARLDPVRDLTLSHGDVLLLQLEIPLETGLAAAVEARRCGARVVLNAAPLAPPDPVFAELLTHVDVLVLNESEAAALTGAAMTPTDVEGWCTLAARLPAPTCVVTLGSRGAVAADAAGTWWQPAFPASIVDTTGAGDAFCGALAQSLAAGHDLRDAVRRGCAAGAHAAGRLGAQAALPTARELSTILATQDPHNRR